MRGRAGEAAARPAPGRRLTALSAAGLLLFGIVLALVVAEFALRALVHFELLGPDSRFVGLLRETQGEALFRPSDDPVLEYEFVPGSRRGLVRINSDGLRGREYAREPVPGTVRVAVLGDSESAGMMLPESETFPAALEQELNRARPGGFEVLDFSVPGYNVEQKVRTLEKALRFSPAVVVFYYVFNDPLPNTISAVQRRSPLAGSHALLLARRAADLLRPSTYQQWHASRDIVGFFQDLHRSEEFENFKRRMRDAGTALRGMGVRFVLVVSPELLGYDDFAAYPHRNIHRALLGLSSPEIEVVDPLEALTATGRRPTELWVTPYDCHKGKLANAVIAGSVARHLLADGKR